MAKENISQIIQKIKHHEERIECLEKAVFSKGRFKHNEKGGTNISADINFVLNERAFVNRYAAKKSGPRKFTLILAYLVKGKIGENTNLDVIKKHWNKMKSLLGNFNMFYTNEAKTRGWVDVEGHGIYKLTKEWEQAL